MVMSSIGCNAVSSGGRARMSESSSSSSSSSPSTTWGGALVPRRPPRPRVVVKETPEDFVRATPFISQEIERRQWVYQIIDGLLEQERVLLNTPDFMVVPDIEAPPTEQGINWLVIFKDLSLRSLRDLRGAHLPLLRRVKDALAMLLSTPCETMLYFHSPPSVWQLHLHVVGPCDVLRTTNDMQKVHFIDDVMSNLVVDPDYYRRVTMTYVLPVTHEFCRLYTPSSPPEQPLAVEEEEEEEEEKEEKVNKDRQSDPCASSSSSSSHAPIH